MPVPVRDGLSPNDAWRLAVLSPIPQLSRRLALDRPVDGGAGDAEQVSKFCRRVLAGALRAVPGSSCGPAHRSLGVLGDHAGEMAVLAYLLLKGTGRRVGEVASLHLGCLDVDEDGKPVLIYDNHKALRMRRRLPLADSALVEAIRAQQAWVSDRFPDTAATKLWLLPRGTRNITGTAHIPANQLAMWIRVWVRRIPRIDAGTRK